MTTNKSREFTADSGRKISPFLVLDYSFFGKAITSSKAIKVRPKVR